MLSLPPTEIINCITQKFCPKSDQIFYNLHGTLLYIYYSLARHLSNKNGNFSDVLLLRKASYRIKKSGRQISKYHY